MDQTLTSILNGFRDAAFLLDANRRVLAANAAGEAMFGVVEPGRDFVWRVRQPDCLRLIDEVRRGEARAQGVVTLNAPVRGVFQVTAAEVHGGAHKNAPRVVVSFADVSHIRDAEQMRSDFVANVSHELRSPLTALSGFIETLRGPARGDVAASDRFLGLMEREAQRMTRLIADLLSLSRVEDRERVRPRGAANLQSVLSRVIATLAHQAEKDGVSLTLTAADSPALLIAGDEDELTQVFQNLIENAIKYGGRDNPVEVTLSRAPSAAGMVGGAIRASVRDHGPGIDKSHHSRLTERFYRVDTGRSRDKGGTGLGLAIVKHIVQRHRGRLVIESTPGQGSEFTVLFPALAQGAPDSDGASD